VVGLLNRSTNTLAMYPRHTPVNSAIVIIIYKTLAHSHAAVKLRRYFPRR
jgi:hypothetical protein